jgi:glycosyltransferase involved in cell wall biosynthesis
MQMHVLIDAINGNEHVRGPDRYLLSLLGGLADLEGNDRYTIVYAPWQQGFKNVNLGDRFTSLCLSPPRGAGGRVIWHTRRFPQVVEELQPDVVHLPNVIRVPRLHVPIVMTVHDLAHFRYPEKFGPLRGRLQRVLVRNAVRVPEKLIAVSEFTRADLLRFTGVEANRIAMIGEGAPAPEAIAPRADWPLFLLYVGQIERSKNIEGLIDAFASSQSLHDAGVHLWLAGKPGNAQDLVEHKIAESGSDRIRLIGYVEEAKLKELYASCLAFVFPSLVEGFGLVLLEAMAFNAPVVAMRATAVPEVVGEAGILVDPDDPNALRVAIESVVRDEELRADMRRRGQERIVLFSWKKVAAATRAIYQAAGAV